MKKLLAALLCLLPLSGFAASTQTIFEAPATACDDTGGQHANFTFSSAGMMKWKCGTSGSAAGVTQLSFQWGVPVFFPPGGFFANNGKYVIGQAPASSATLTVSATSGSVTATFSAATLLGTASDVGRVITILDTTYKYCTITAQSSTTVATCTISGGTWSTTGAWANNAVWISGAAGGTASYSTLLPYVVANAYFYFPVNVISAATAAGVYYTQCESTTVCTVFNNALTSGPPIHISSPTAFSVTGTGAWSQTAGSYISVISLTIPGGAIGNNGALTYYSRNICVNDSNAKLIQVALGGTAIGIQSVTTQGWMPFARTVSNLDAANVQVIASAAAGFANDSAQSTSSVFLAVDTSTNQTLAIALRVATSTDWDAIMNGTVTINTAP
jgi:hypothetical protein